MGYRDDLEAAHARIAALELENATLREELEAARTAIADMSRVPVDKGGLAPHFVTPPERGTPDRRAWQPPLHATGSIDADAPVALREWTELAELQAQIVHTADRVERARLMRRLAELHEAFGEPDTAEELRDRARELDP